MRYTSKVPLSELDIPNADNQNDAENIPGMFEELSLHGKITTEIFVSKQSLLPGETLDLVITYTPYKGDYHEINN